MFTFHRNIDHAYRMPRVLSVRDVQCELSGRRSGGADGRSALRASASRPLRHSRLRLPRLFFERSRPARSHLLRPTLVPVRRTVTARSRPSVPERPHLLPGSHLPLRHRYAEYARYWYVGFLCTLLCLNECTYYQMFSLRDRNIILVLEPKSSTKF